MEWTKSDTLKFIELWQSFPCLWDTKINDYKNKRMRSDALSNFAIEMSTDINSIEKKMVSLRTQFNREINKLKTKSEAGLDEAQSNWYAFEYLLFLKDSKVHRPSTDSPKVHTPREERRSVYKRKHDKSPENLGRHYHDSQSRTHNESKIISTNCNKQEKDEFSVFGETIANELREIKSKRHLLVIKKEIMDLVFRIKLEILDSDMDPIGVVAKEVEVGIDEVQND